MKRSLFAFLCFVSFFLVVPFAFAQTDPAAGTETGNVTVYGEKAWTAPLVEGDLVRPDGFLVHGKREGRTSILIRVRSSFRPEILKSVDNL